MSLDLSHLVVAILSAMAGAIWMRWRHRPQTTDTGPIISARSPVRVSTSEPRLEGEKLGLAERLFTCLFLTGWLIGWTFGIASVAAGLWSGESEAVVFLAGWLIAAVAAWFAGAYSLAQAIQGRRPTLTGRH